MNQVNPSTSTPKAKGGCFSSVFKLMGFLTAFLCIVSYILGLFDYQLKISGSKFPKLDLPMLLLMLGIAAFFFLIGWLIGKMEDRIAAKKAAKNNPE